MKKLIVSLIFTLMTVGAFAQAVAYTPELVMAATNGDTKAQYGLAECYFYGIGVRADLDKALEYYLKAADGGDTKGAFKYGVLGLMKATFDEDQATMEKCLGFLESNSQNGDTKSSFFLAKICANIMEKTPILYLFRLKADDGLPQEIRDEVANMAAVANGERSLPRDSKYTPQTAIEWMGLKGKFIEMEYNKIINFSLGIIATLRKLTPEQIQSDIKNTQIDIVPDEDSQSSFMDTYIYVVPDDEVVNEVRTQDELSEDRPHMGAVDIMDGADDMTRHTIRQEVVKRPDDPAKPQQSDIVYNTANVQKQPEFPGGEAKMYEWLAQNIQYPKAAYEEGVSGRVIVDFIINENGEVMNAKVVRGRHPALDREALRVVRSMPVWTPGSNNGQPVKVSYILPVTFKLPAKAE